MTTRQNPTRDALLAHGRRLFWLQGYGNVSVRDITGAAGVDGALVSRYFGGKLGLFEETLAQMDALDIAAIPDKATLVKELVRVFEEAERGPETPSVLTLVLANARDPDAGPLVCAEVTRRWQDPMAELLGSKPLAAMITAVVFGFSVAEKMLDVPGIHAPGSPEYRAQVEHMLRAALDSPA